MDEKENLEMLAEIARQEKEALGQMEKPVDVETSQDPVVGKKGERIYSRKLKKRAPADAPIDDVETSLDPPTQAPRSSKRQKKTETPTPAKATRGSKRLRKQDGTVDKPEEKQQSESDHSIDSDEPICHSIKRSRTETGASAASGTARAESSSRGAKKQQAEQNSVLTALLVFGGGCCTTSLISVVFLAALVSVNCFLTPLELDSALSLSADALASPPVFRLFTTWLISSPESILSSDSD
jgi:hypothetical protein